MKITGTILSIRREHTETLAFEASTKLFFHFIFHVTEGTINCRRSQSHGFISKRSCIIHLKIQQPVLTSCDSFWCTQLISDIKHHKDDIFFNICTRDSFMKQKKKVAAFLPLRFLDVLVWSKPSYTNPVRSSLSLFVSNNYSINHANIQLTGRTSTSTALPTQPITNDYYT